MSFVGDLWDGITGQSGVDAAENATVAQTQAGQDAIAEQRRASEAAMEYQREAAAQGQGYLDPYQAIGQQGLDQMGFLNDSQAQFDWLQGNPLFQMGLDNANRTTQASSAASGRLSAGDTLMQLNNNALLTAQPLINSRKNDIWNQLGQGQNLATAQANTAMGVGTNLGNIQTGLGNNVSGLLTDIGNVNAAGIGNAYNAQQNGMMGGISQQIGGALTGGIGGGLGGLISGGISSLFSDSRLKDNAEIIGKKNGYDVWKWTWNADAKKLFNLEGDSSGVMFSEVIKKNPEAVSYQDGYGKVNYTAIGV